MVVKKDDVIQLELPEKGDKLLSQELYVFQWNKGQKLEILNVPDGTEVDFGNDKVETTLNRIKTDGFVEIPDIMLTYAEPISAYVQYISSDSETTRIQIIIKVIERPMPGDYVYPDDEQSFREQMEQIMLDTKEIAQNALDKASNVEKRANDGEFNGDSYTITQNDYEEIANIVLQNTDTDIMQQKEIAKEEIAKTTEGNIKNVNDVTNKNIDNINDVTNNSIEIIIPNAKNAAINEINSVKTNVLNSIADKEASTIEKINYRETNALSNLAKEESILANNLNTDANNHIKNINDQANQKLEEINNSASGKVNIKQGTENANKVLVTDDNGNVNLSEDYITEDQVKSLIDNAVTNAIGGSY